MNLMNATECNFFDPQMIAPVEKCTCGNEIFPGEMIVEYDGEHYCDYECLCNQLKKRGELLHVTA